MPWSNSAASIGERDEGLPARAIGGYPCLDVMRCFPFLHFGLFLVVVLFNSYHPHTCHLQYEGLCSIPSVVLLHLDCNTGGKRSDKTADRGEGNHRLFHKLLALMYMPLSGCINRAVSVLDQGHQTHQTIVLADRVANICNVCAAQTRSMLEKGNRWGLSICALHGKNLSITVFHSLQVPQTKYLQCRTALNVSTSCAGKAD